MMELDRPRVDPQPGTTGFTSGPRSFLCVALLGLPTAVGCAAAGSASAETAAAAPPVSPGMFAQGPAGGGVPDSEAASDAPESASGGGEFAKAGAAPPA